MATIRDVANASEVSIATVSRVLNGNDGKVGAETRARVLAAVRELRYRPTAQQESQGAAATHNIGLLVSDLDRHPIRNNLYFTEILDGVLEEAATKGYSTTIFVERMWRDKKLAIRRSYDGHCDGIIAIAPVADAETVPLLHERGVPMVLVGSELPLEGVSTIDIDNRAAAHEAVRLLAAQGHRRIAYFGVPERVVSSHERRLACLEAADAIPGVRLDFYLSAGVTQFQSSRLRTENELSPEPLNARGFHQLNWVPEMVETAFASDPPTAIVSWNDELAIEILAELGRRGLTVPGQVALISFDDMAPARGVTTLTSFSQPLYEMGRRAVNLLLSHLSEPDSLAQRVRLRSELVHRESVGPPPSAARHFR